jgi:1-acyl-sn-glycerol-3-phosphate acyltransferase
MLVNVLIFLSVLVLGCIAGVVILFFGCRPYARVARDSAFVQGLEGINQWMCRRYHRLGDCVLSVPPSGPAIVVANHQSGLDPFVIGALCDRPIYFLMLKEYYDLFGFQWFFKKVGCIPVTKDGDHNVFALRQALRILKSGGVVALFPFGGFHLPGDPEPEMKHGVQLLAEATNAPIYPVYIQGIKGKGCVFLAPFLRSRLKVTLYPARACHRDNATRVLEELKVLLSNHVTENQKISVDNERETQKEC